MKRNSSGVIVWLRRDLRLTDNPALLAAVRRGGAVWPVFIWSPEELGREAPGSASRWWLHHSLAALDADLRDRGSRLIIRSGPTLQTLRDLLNETGASALHWNRLYDPAARRLDAQVEAALAKLGVETKSHGSLLYEPEEIATKTGQPYQVFTAFWKACRKLRDPHPPEGAPSKIETPQSRTKSLKLRDLQLLPKIDWAAGIRAAWRPGEAGAREQLEFFLRGALADYATLRNHPAEAGTSRLSPHLHFGEFSLRELYWAVRESHHPATEIDRYLTELGWRDFAHHLLYRFPQTIDEPLRAEFARFPWLKDRRRLKAWQRGQTGYPIVDAGLRQLWQTGWMHNRVRMIVASFLVKDLLIRWQEGAAWFWDTLVDADLANNTLGWQWTAGCGADAALYFRVFNPVLQGEKFDPDGAYVRRFCPELSRLPNSYIHQPWEAPAEVLSKSGVTLGQTYPHPIVNHAEARLGALAAFKQIR